MARSNAPQVSEFPFHITARTPNRCPFPIPLIRLWEIMSEELFWVHKKYRFEIMSFVLMPNHFHLIGRTTEFPLGKILNDFMRDNSKRINKESDKINQNWGETAYRCLISNPSYFLNVYRYVYQNPVRANLCNKVEEYAFSTLYGKLGQGHLLIPVIEDSTLFDNKIESTLKWLNTKQLSQEIEYIRHGLMYQEFKIKKDANRRILLHPDALPTHK